MNSIRISGGNLKGKKVYATKQSREFVNELFSAVADEDVKKISD